MKIRFFRKTKKIYPELRNQEAKWEDSHKKIKSKNILHKNKQNLQKTNRNQKDWLNCPPHTATRNSSNQELKTHKVTFKSNLSPTYSSVTMKTSLMNVTSVSEKERGKLKNWEKLWLRSKKLNFKNNCSFSSPWLKGLI